MKIKKFLATIATFATLFNSLSAPALVLAQEFTPEPTAIESSTPAPTPETESTPESTPTETATVAPEATEESTPTPEVAPEGQITTTVIANVDLSEIDTGVVTTDKADYTPTELVYIYVSELTANTEYTLIVSSEDNPAITFSTNVTTDASGSFTYVYQLDGNYRPNYSINVKSGATVVASTTFTDAFTPGIDLYSQCANDDGDGYASGDIGCRWTNGNLNGSNSTYHEGDATVQRVAIKDLKAGDHTVTIQYDSLKSGKHAYDYLTDDNFSELAPNALTDSDLCDPSLSNFASCSSTNPGGISSSIIPPAPNANGYDTASGTNRRFKIRNGTWVSGGIFSGPTVVAGADQPTNVQLKFTVDPSTCANSYSVQNTAVCEVLITWGTHISRQSDWGVGNSAVNISGSPYHVRVVELDGDNIGNRDNQMAASAIPSTIIIHKNTVPDSTQDFNFTTTGNGLSNFSLDDDGETVVLSDTKTFTGLDEGNFSVTEAAATGYAVSIVCNDPTSNTTVNNSNRIANIDLGPGETVECTFTNTLQNGTLKVIKHVAKNHGGTSTASDFTLHVKNGGVDVAGSPAAGSETGTDYSLPGGVYNVSENTPLPSGYTFVGFSGDCDSNGNVTVVAGVTKTCTITNQDPPGQLTVIKHVINNNGGDANANDFTMHVTAVNPSDADFPGDESGTTIDIDAGAYSVDETGPSGYNSSMSADCTGTIAAGESKTCTITNDDIGPTLKLVKIVTNDNGGTATAGAWTLTATGTSGFSDTGDSTTFHDVLANTGYVLSESTLSGYDYGQFTCNGGSLVGQTLTLDLAENVTCTVTNDDQIAHLIVIKHVINDDGGLLGANDFTMHVTGQNPSQSSFAGEEDPGTAITVNAGSYIVSEDLIDGYTASFSDDCSGNIANGETKTCTITNDDQPAHLILVKHLPNDNGGTATQANFPVFIDAVGAVWGDNQVDAGSYAVSETTMAGYTASDWGTDCSAIGLVSLLPGQTKTCDITNDDEQAFITVTKVVNNAFGGTAVPNDFSLTLEGNSVLSGVATPVNPGTYTAGETLVSGYSFDGFSGDCDQNGDTTVALGESKTCTLTNSDIEPKLTLTKVVTNDNGGNAEVSDFPLFVDTTSVDSGVQNGFDAGTYSASETNLDGYTAGSWTGDCAPDGSVILNVGDIKACTITNDDQPAHIILNKVVNNNHGGQAGANEFGIMVDGGVVLSGATTDVNSNTAHTINEAGLTGYQFVSLTGDVKCPQVLGGEVTLDEGETVECTITNEDIAPTLTVNKVLVPSTDTGLFNLQIDATSEATDVGDGGTTGAVEVNAGNHTVGEVAGTSTDMDDYETLIGGECAVDGSITLALAENKTCTITNTRKATITIVKDASPNDLIDFSFTGTLGAFMLDDDTGVADIGLNGDIDQAQSKTFTQLAIGQTYTFTETEPNQFWTLESISCDSGTYNSNGTTLNVTNVEAGADITCTFVNKKLSPTRTQGFWKTHTAYTTSALAGFPGDTMIIGNGGPSQEPIDSINKLMGGYYADNAKKTDGKKRTAVDQARIILAKQLMTAKLNCQTFGCPASIMSLITNADNAYGAGILGLMQSYTSQLDAYNNSGDTITVGPAGSATPKTSMGIADTVFWNQP